MALSADGSQLSVSPNECARLLMNLAQDPQAKLAYTYEGRSFRLVSEVTGGRHFPLHFSNQKVELQLLNHGLRSFREGQSLATARVVVDRFQIWQPEQPDIERKSYLRLEYRIEQSDPRLTALKDHKDISDTFGLTGIQSKKELARYQDLFMELPFSPKAQIHLLKNGQMLVLEDGKLFISSDISLLAIAPSLKRIQSLSNFRAEGPIPLDLQLETLVADATEFRVIQDDSSSSSQPRVFVHVERRYSQQNSRDWPVVLRLSLYSKTSRSELVLRNSQGETIVTSTYKHAVAAPVARFEPQRRGELLIHSVDGQPRLGLDVYRQKAPHPALTPPPSLMDRLRSQIPFLHPRNQLGIEFSGVQVLSAERPWSLQLKTRLVELNEASILKRVQSFAFANGSVHTLVVRGEQTLELATRPPISWRENDHSPLTLEIPLKREDVNHKGRTVSSELRQSVLIMQRLLVSAYYKEGEFFHLMSLYDLQTGEEHLFRIANKSDNFHHPTAFLDFIVSLEELSDIITLRYQFPMKPTSYREPDKTRHSREAAAFYERVRALFLSMRQMPQARYNELLTEIFVKKD